ncbi:MAG: metalloregulator ArsR/SmtB family transcription factor [Thermoplasmatales archaeon]|nr:metalloregulator ArsR/SmtB family transcription factor [Thermoplasmatales archaeon]
MNEDKFLKCISDGNRRRILECLGSNEKCVNEIIKETGLEQSLVSFHLKALRNCGLIKNRREGKKIMYKISHKGVIKVLDFIKEVSSRIKELNESDLCE